MTITKVFLAKSKTRIFFLMGLPMIDHSDGKQSSRPSFFSFFLDVQQVNFHKLRSSHQKMNLERYDKY